MEPSGAVVSCDNILVVIGEHTISSFETENFKQLSQQSMLIPTVTNVLQVERELLVLSKTDTNSSLSFLQQDYYLDKLTEGKHFGDVQDMWTFKNEGEEHLLVSSDQSSHIFKLSNRSPTKVSLSEVEDKNDLILMTEATLSFNERLGIQIT